MHTPITFYKRKSTVKSPDERGVPYFLIGVARRDSKHVGLFSKNFSPVSLTGLHPVLKMVLVVRVESLDTRKKTEDINTYSPYISTM